MIASTSRVFNQAEILQLSDLSLARDTVEEPESLDDAADPPGMDV